MAALITPRHAAAAVVCLTLFSIPAATAAVWRVPEDRPSVESALASAASGDTVLLAPGVYAGGVLLPVGVTLRAADPSQPAVLDAGGAGPALTSVSGSASSRLEAVILRGASGDGAGGGVLVQGGQLALRDVRVESCAARFGGAAAVVSQGRLTWAGGAITGCSATIGGGLFLDGGSAELSDVLLTGNTAQTGGGLYVQDASPLALVSCTLENNQASGDGGGLFLVRSGASLSDCRLRGNRAGGAGGGLAAGPGTHAVCGYTVFSDNQASAGGAVHATCDGPAGASCARLELVHCDLMRNTAGLSGAGGVAGAARLDAEACIVAFNSGGLACLDPRATLDVACTLLHGNGPGPAPDDCAHAYADTIGEDPLFCDLSSGSVGLCANSPALDRLACGTPYLGAEGQECADCLTTATLSTTWGALKARYR